MKNAKKVFAMLIVLALAISMAIPVSAAGTGSIKIKDAYVGQTYSAYKMADLNYVKGDPEHNVADKYAYSIAAEGNPWLAFWQQYDSNDGDNYLFDVIKSAEGDIYTITKKDGVTDAQIADFAVAAVAYAKDSRNNISAANTVTPTPAAGDPATTTTTAYITNLEDGYYAVDTTTGTVCILNTVDGGDETEISEKNNVPQIDKDITKVNGETMNADATDVKIGDVVEYTITVPVVKGAHNYVVTDTLSAGLDLVYTDGKLAEAFNISGGTTKEAITYANRVITIKLNDTFSDTEVVIKYYAKVNSAAVTNHNGLNTVTLKFGDNSQITSDTVEVFPLDFNIEKTDGNNLLPGAKFVIYQEANNVKSYLTFDENYVYTGTKSKLAEATVLESDDGNYHIDGGRCRNVSADLYSPAGA